MVYHAIGIMSGSSLDGLDLAYVSFQEQGGKWSYEFKHTACYAYSTEWADQLKNAIHLSARDYQLLHIAYGHYIGEQVNRFRNEHELQYKINLVSSHGHTTFHIPEKKMTAQLGDGASIAAETGLSVVSDLRAMDLAFGGQGAPIVPIGEKMLLGDFDFFLNLGGIANISHNDPEKYIAFDICAANRVLNMLVNKLGKEFDEGGKLASTGELNNELLEKLNQLDYYKLPHPKSLANDFGTDNVYPMVERNNLSIPDALRTYTEHIVFQINKAVVGLKNHKPQTTIPIAIRNKLLVTGGGALNDFLIEKLTDLLKESEVEVVVPDTQLINFKEAMVMALMGVLRWRQEYNVLASVTGASRNSIGGAIWTGEEA